MTNQLLTLCRTRQVQVNPLGKAVHFYNILYANRRNSETYIAFVLYKSPVQLGALTGIQDK